MTTTTTTRTLSLLFLGLPLWGACTDADSDEEGDARFRAAVPTRADALLRVPGADAPPDERAAPGYRWAAGVAHDTNQAIGDVFLAFEQAIDRDPEIAASDAHQWRMPVGELDRVLRVEGADDANLALTYDLVPRGTAPVPPVVVGGAVSADDFDLAIDYDALGATGDVVVSRRPFTGGRAARVYDFRGYSTPSIRLDSRIENWQFTSPDDSALELVDETDGYLTAIYVRWDARGGRSDTHLRSPDDNIVSTSCWSPDGALTFFGRAELFVDGSSYSEVVGDEADCVFGPLDKHPTPFEPYDGLPGRGEWARI